ncbi:MAG TPA: NADH-quinone oxidoreductase subunit NuoE [Candidatus Dormibacteraeota bacterium]|nr:NADH-quinone oxidoreductase subunit NuoE [Candidatus Dormibacteraeota bacterium]
MALDFEALRARLQPEIDRIVAQYPQRRSALLPLVHLFQEQIGFATPEAVDFVARTCGVTPAQCESVITFYTLFYRRPIGKYNLQVCRNLSCTLRGAKEIMERFRERLGIGHLETTDDGLFSYEEVECLAACDRAPCMQVNLRFVYDLTPEMVDEMIEAMRAGAYGVEPLAQTEQPPREVRGPAWPRAARKSAGAVGVPNPNNAGGVGDEPGRMAAERFREEGVLAVSAPGRFADAETVDAMLPAPHDQTVMEGNY